MERRALSNSVGVVLLVVGILIGAGGYYFTTSDFLPAQSRASSSFLSTTTALSKSSAGVTTAPVGPCNVTVPLTLASASWLSQPVNAQEPGSLSMVWSNCAAQSIKFAVGQSANEIVLSMFAYGKATQYAGYIYNYAPSYFSPEVFTVPADGTVTTTLPVYVYNTYSANAVVQWVSGPVVAIDPNTGQTISVVKNLNVTG